MAIDFSTWEILNASNRPICDYEGIVGCNVVEASQVLTEPLENGLLAAYNRVTAPDAVSITLAISGDPSVQAQALDDLRQLKRAIGSNALCTLVTPYLVINNLALETISQSRSSSINATLLLCELGFTSVRVVQTGTAKVEWSPRNPTSADGVNSGKVQPKTSAARLSDFIRG